MLHAEKYAPIHETPHQGKDIYIGSTWKEVFYIEMDGREKKVAIRIVFEITKRTIDKYGQVLLVHDVEVN